MDRQKIKKRYLPLYMFVFSAVSACSLFPTDRGTSPPPASNHPSFFAPQSSRAAFKPDPLPVNRPVQQTFEADPVRYATLSGDGRLMVAISEMDGISRMVLRPVNPSRDAPPRVLPHLSGSVMWPALSRDGRWLAFQGTAFDVKGDIYLIDLTSQNQRPIRLTDRATGDGAPAFSPDGTDLYFHQSSSKNPGRRLMRIPLPETLSQSAVSGPITPALQALPVDGDGSFPAISPDGVRMAFVSRREDPNGDIFLLDLKTQDVRRITQGPAIDAQPCWSRDGDFIYFSRMVPQRSADAGTEHAEAIRLYRIAAKHPGAMPYPLTSGAYEAYQPMLTKSGLYFITHRRGIPNVWALPPGAKSQNAIRFKNSSISRKTWAYASHRMTG
ncbi:MAG: hypothetical protein U5R49_20095 [Deltaproteobacteria bacterium]|nr:hypothetical protein [Deltaproteobacteria bacterium]